MGFKWEFSACSNDGVRNWYAEVAARRPRPWKTPTEKAIFDNRHGRHTPEVIYTVTANDNLLVLSSISGDMQEWERMKKKTYNKLFVALMVDEPTQLYRK